VGLSRRERQPSTIVNDDDGRRQCLPATPAIARSAPPRWRQSPCARQRRRRPLPSTRRGLRPLVSWSPYRSTVVAQPTGRRARPANTRSSHHMGCARKQKGPPLSGWPLTCCFLRRRGESNSCTGLCRPLPKPLGHAAAGGQSTGREAGCGSEKTQSGSLAQLRATAFSLGGDHLLGLTTTPPSPSCRSFSAWWHVDTHERLVNGRWSCWPSGTRPSPVH
jgi:hypothetical protein